MSTILFRTQCEVIWVFAVGALIQLEMRWLGSNSALYRLSVELLCTGCSSWCHDMGKLSILLALLNHTDHPPPHPHPTRKAPANERRCYIVMSSPNGWAHTQNDPWSFCLKLTVTRLLVQQLIQAENRENITASSCWPFLKAIKPIILFAALSHYLKQCWLILNRTPQNKFHWNLKKKYKHFHWWKCVRKCRLLKTAAILFRPQCVKHDAKTPVASANPSG